MQYQIEESVAPSNSWRRDLVPGLVSIVMPAYNAAASLAESVHSVLQQTYQQWELIVVDDGSADASVAIARRLAAQDERIRVIVQGENRGIAEARNTGIDAACGQYLSFLDSDDLWLPHKLSVQVEFLQARHAGFCFASYCRWDGTQTVGAPVPVPRSVRYSHLLCGNAIACLTVLIDRERVPSFRMPRIPHEDYAAWLAILRGGVVAYGIPIDVARYRLSPKSVSANKFRSALWTWRILRTQERLPLARAGWCFLRYAVRAISVRRMRTRPLPSDTAWSTERV